MAVRARKFTLYTKKKSHILLKGIFLSSIQLCTQLQDEHIVGNMNHKCFSKSPHTEPIKLDGQGSFINTGTTNVLRSALHPAHEKAPFHSETSSNAERERGHYCRRRWFIFFWRQYRTWNCLLDQS